MAKQKKMYKITRTEVHDYGDGEIKKYEKVWYRPAVSEKQAIARMQWNNGENKYNMHADWWGDGARDVFYEAVEVK